MKQYHRTIDTCTAPDGAQVELALERGHYVIKVAGVPLMTSAMHGSEEEMAQIAQQHLSSVVAPALLVGGLGMGFTLRSCLDAFGSSAVVTVAEILPPILAYNRGVLGPLAGHPLRDERVRLFEGDVRRLLKAERTWDAVLMDVDNGPDAFTTASNQSLYAERGVRMMARSLKKHGILVVWSAYPSRAFEKLLRRVGLNVSTVSVRARGAVKKGPRHFLFVGKKA